MKEIIELMGKSGSFAVGSLFGAWLATQLFKNGHKTMSTAFNTAEDRCRILLEDQRVKDRRIEELHRKLTEHQETQS